MNCNSLFISNYSRIEKEVLELSNNIEFCDAHLKVYSTVICDLIIRCCTDIESLYRELYRKKLSTIPSQTTGEIVVSLDNHLHLVPKMLSIENSAFNFEHFNIIRPFNYQKKTEDDFYHVFCQLKHDRYRSLPKATLTALLLSLGALYILNQYYLDEQMPIENTLFGEIIPTQLSRHTHIFAAKVFNKIQYRIDSSLNKLVDNKKYTKETIDIIKTNIAKNTIIQGPQYKRSECLFKLEAMSEQKKISEDLISTCSDRAEQNAILASLICGDIKDTEVLIGKYDTQNILDAISSLFQSILHRNRVRVVINS